MDPLSVSSFVPAPVRGSALSRGLKAVFVEHRLPYQLARRWHRALTSFGLPLKTVPIDRWSFRVRRLGVDEDVLRNVLVAREYHPPGYEIGPDDTVIDVGGNIGAFAVPAATAAHSGRVIAVEPDDGNHRLLTENLRRNGCRNAVIVHSAVTGSGGAVRLVTEADSSGHRVEAGHGPGKMVPAVRLADLFDEYGIERCDFLKLDCEGAEYGILTSFPAEYFARIRRIAMEYHAESAHKRERAEALIHQLRENRFRIDRYTEVTGEPVGHLFATREE